MMTSQQNSCFLSFLLSQAFLLKPAGSGLQGCPKEYLIVSTGTEVIFSSRGRVSIASSGGGGQKLVCRAETGLGTTEWG